MAPKGKQITLDDGRIAYEYPDGSIRNPDGSYAIAPPWKYRDFDERDARRRHEMAREAAALGIQEEAGVMSEAEAAKWTAKTTTAILKEKNGTASVQAAKFLWRIAGWAPDRGASGPAIVQNILQLPPGILKELAQRAGTGTDDTED